MDQVYIIRRQKDGRFCDIDSVSGGYPYFVEKIRNAKFFTSRDEALSYAAKFDEREADEWEILTISLSEVESVDISKYTNYRFVFNGLVAAYSRDHAEEMVRKLIDSMDGHFGKPTIEVRGD